MISTKKKYYVKTDKKFYDNVNEKKILKLIGKYILYHFVFFECI